MQERMLWRVYSFVSEQKAIRNGGPALPPIEVAPSLLSNEGDKKILTEMRQMIEAHTALHKKWRMIHGIAILPVLCLSLLPFVKLWLAWEIFRTVTHHRAYVGARWIREHLRSGLGVRRRPSRQSAVALEGGLIEKGSGFVENELLERERFQEIDEELPDILHKI